MWDCRDPHWPAQCLGLLANRPVLDFEFGKRKMPWVSGRQWNPQRYGRGGDQAVCLCERDSGSCVVPSPSAGELAVGAVDLDNLQTIEQVVGSRRFI